VLCIAGRTTDVINRGGFKISAVKIAGIIETLTSVKEAAACGVEGKSGLEEVWVAVVPNGEIDAAKIKTLVANHDEGGVEVDEVFVVDEIPRGDLGKVQKIRLKDMLLKLKRGA
jgi:acyl-coenzyme A synthetase/AMP-(fatty) acid ligase